MNLLIDQVPKSVMIDGLEYEINTDFRIGILFEQLSEEHDLSYEQKADIAINMYFPIKPFNTVEALKKILWFYSCGKEKNKESNTRKETIKQKDIFSYDLDDVYIYSAFLQQYKIDLQDVKDLHWWKFRAMFQSLSECKFTDIMGYRSINIDSKMPKEQQKFYRKMKALYKLPDNRTEEEKEAAIISAFNGCF